MTPEDNGSLATTPAAPATPPPPSDPAPVSSAPDAPTVNAGMPVTGGTAPAPVSGDWRASLPQELREDPALKPYTDVAGLAKSLIHAQKAIGAEKIPVPGKNATDEDYRKVFQRLGLPEKVDQYEIKYDESKTKVDDGVFKGFKEAAHQAGILPRQAQQLFDWYQEKTGQLLGEVETKRETSVVEGLRGLKEEWGQGFDKEMNVARSAFKEFTTPEEQAYLKEQGLDYDPKLIRIFNRMGGMLSEDKLIGQDTKNFGMTPDEAARQIATIQGDPKHPYYDRSHPGHDQAVEEMGKLFKARSG